MSERTEMPEAAGFCDDNSCQLYLDDDNHVVCDVCKQDWGLHPSYEKDVPDQGPTYMALGDKGTGTIPENFLSYRVTSNNRDQVFDFFRGCKCVMAEEISKSGVQHYHIVVEGFDEYELVKKRLTRAKLGVNKWWSKKNSGDFYKAVAYTIKCGEYFTRKGFHVHTDYVENNCPWVFGQITPLVEDGQKDSDKDWMLTYNNLLRVAQNHARKNHILSDDLGVVLSHLTEHTRWIPSPQMMKAGLDPWFFKMYKFRLGSIHVVPDWWTPRSI